jgi:hypothetical protein
MLCVVSTIFRKRVRGENDDPGSVDTNEDLIAMSTGLPCLAARLAKRPRAYKGGGAKRMSKS